MAGGSTKSDLWIAAFALAAGIAAGLLILSLRADPEPKEVVWPHRIVAP